MTCISLYTHNGGFAEKETMNYKIWAKVAFKTGGCLRIGKDKDGNVNLYRRHYSQVEPNINALYCHNKLSFNVLFCCCFFFSILSGCCDPFRKSIAPNS